MCSPSQGYYQSTHAMTTPTENIDPWEHRSTRMRCSTCMWFALKRPTSEDVYYDEREATAPAQVGRCRRHAPTMTGYPVVFSNDWCGDHKLNENAI